MGTMIFLGALFLASCWLTWYLEEHEDEIEENRMIGELVKASKRRAGMRQGRNPVRLAACGYRPTRVKVKRRRRR